MKKSAIILEKIINIFNFVLSLLGVLFLIAFVGSTIYQVVARNVLPVAPIWTEEAARFAFIFMVSCGVGLAVYTGDYVGVELIVDLFPQKVQKIIKVTTMFLLAAFCFWYHIVSVRGFAIFDYRYVSTAMRIPMQYIYISMRILFPSLGLSYIFAALQQIFMPPDKDVLDGREENKEV